MELKFKNHLTIFHVTNEYFVYVENKLNELINILHRNIINILELYSLPETYQSQLHFKLLRAPLLFKNQPLW